MDFEQACLSALNTFLAKKGKSHQQIVDSLKTTTRAKNHLMRQLRGERPLLLENLSDIVAYLRIPSEVFLASVHDLVKLPVLEPLEVPPSRFANLLTQRIPGSLTGDEEQDLADAVPDHYLEPTHVSDTVEPTAEVRGLLAQVDEAPKTAFDRAKAAVKISAQEVPRGPEDVLRHASLVHAWGVAALRVGRLRLAGRLTSWALHLHGAATYSPTYPSALRTAAVLFQHYGAERVALSAVETAFFHSCLAEGGSVGRSRSLLAQSTLALSYGYFGQAKKLLKHRGEVIEELRFRYEHALALVHLDEGDEGAVARAAACLEAEAPRTRREELFALWLSALIDSSRDLPADARSKLDQLWDESRELLSPVDRLEVLLDRLLTLRSEPTSVLQKAAELALEHLERVEVASLLDDVREDLTAVATDGKLDFGLEGRYKRPLLQDW